MPVSQHQPQPTEESILSHDGLAELIATPIDRWPGSSGSKSAADHVDQGEHQDGHRTVRTIARPALALRQFDQIAAVPPTGWSPRATSFQYTTSQSASPASYSPSWKPLHEDIQPGHPSYRLETLTSSDSFSPFIEDTISQLSSPYAKLSRPRTHDSYPLQRLESIEEPEFGQGSFEGTGGTYHHGIGYDLNHGRGSKDKIAGAKLAARVRRLEKYHGAASPPETGRGEAWADSKDRWKRVKAAEKREEEMERQRSGVDQKGRLLVSGRKKRATVRWLQGLGAIAVGIGSLGATLLTHPNGRAPPQRTLTIYALSLAPFISFAVTIHRFVIQPCLHLQRSKRPLSQEESASMAALHPLSMHSSGPQPNSSSCFGCCKTRTRAPRHYQENQYQPTSVNVIVDPALFAAQYREQHQGYRGSIAERERRRRKQQKRRKRKKARASRLAADGNSVETDLLSSSSTLSSLSSDSEVEQSVSSSNPRSFSSILSHVNLEQRWLVARKQVKWNAFIDLAFAVLWGAIGFYAIGFGAKCPPGSFAGYCDLYNTAVAAAVLLSCAFLAAFTFDCFDLSRSKVSPRHRQQRMSLTTLADRDGGGSDLV
ncbi:uncharacterized protein JCM15063_000202 [Sporobolomyces koalae]|uniref:uncharacterized protein n=1 Tax=Sporobolomyces koalae TaxID=500713 RepID=UPI00316E131B